MIKNKSRFSLRSGFTIVELIVVIAVIAILASIVIVSYGAWRTSTATSSIKNDLTHAASAMESYRSFNNTYPTTSAQFASMTSFTASANNTVTPTNLAASAYCLDGTTSQSSSIKYYIDNLTQNNGPMSGTCGGRTVASAAVAPTSVAITSVAGSQASLSWPVVTGATSYNAQCATDPTYIYGLVQTSTTMTAGSTVSATLNGLQDSTTIYCRVNAVSSAGTSEWTTAASNSTTTTAYGSLAVGTSIEGYWTTPPKGFLFEDGSAISRSTYADLFAVIGTTYGAGDGSTTFNLPDSRGRAVVGKSTTGSTFANTNFGVLGAKFGQKSLQLTVAQLPAHNHGEFIGNTDDLNWTGSTSGNQVPPSDAGSGPWDNGAKTSVSGGSAAFSKLEPSIVRMNAVKYTPIDTNAPTYPAGTSIHGYWSTAPSGYMLENGAAVSRTTYAALYSVTSTTYGIGDGSSTFNIPNMQGLVAFNLNTSDTSFNTVGKQQGEDTHALTINEIPAHTHNDPIGPVDDQNWTGNVSANQYPPGDAGGVYDLGTVTGTTGSGQAFTQSQPVIVQNFAVNTTTPTGTGSPVSPGTSVEGYWSTIPAGYLAENGQTVSRSTYADLFAVIGTTYGAGDGSTTFTLPNSQGRLSVNLSNGDSEFNTLGELAGAKTHLLTNSEMPAHSHSLLVGTIDDKNWTGYQGSNPQQYAPADSTVAPTAGSIYVKSVGGGQAFPILQKYMTKQFVIKT